MRHIVDFSLSTVSAATDKTYDELAMGHVLTALEPLGRNVLRAKGFRRYESNPRRPSRDLAVCRLHYLEETTTAGTGATSSSINGLAAKVAEAIETGSSVQDAVLKTVCRKFSSSFLVPKDKLDVTESISSDGVESMLVAEFRAWMLQAFKADVPYLTLLSPAATLAALSDIITLKITERK